MSTIPSLRDNLLKQFGSDINLLEAFNEITIEVKAEDLLKIAESLKKIPEFHFEMLMDICGVDYLEYGVSEWVTDDATNTAFSRGVETENSESSPYRWTKPRFAVVYHLLSLKHNHRLRMRTFPFGEPPRVSSVLHLWKSADWYEREAFDLFGILFEGHPDLRRLLTDYGFIGHPFRKDFPLIGNLEVRYSAKDKRVIYEPVSIPPRTLVPKVIRDDHRYIVEEPKE